MAEKTSTIFERESRNLESARKFLERKGYSRDEAGAQIKKMHEEYSDLLDQVMMITRISDRLQRKLDRTNEKLNKFNEELNKKNIELENTIDALTKARVSRKATTIVFIVAIILFVLTEALIEPEIESVVNNDWIGLLLKFFVAALIKPGEMLLEKSLLKRARNREIKQSVQEG